MAVDEEQLAVLLQASLDHARKRLDEAGGFLPFGTRALLTGEIEFLEASDENGAPVGAVYGQIGAMLADDARQGRILAAALVANAGLPAGAEEDFETAVSVQVEAAGFCRSIVVPYRLSGGTAEFGMMIPEEADPIVFAD
jgi:hypothetical protein